jgi:hypothetical protein
LAHRESRTDNDRRAHRDYARAYSSWVHSIIEQAEAGNESAIAELRKLELLSKDLPEGCSLLRPLPYEKTIAATNNSDDDEAPNPADLVVDHRTPIVDFESVNDLELQRLCDHFGAALVWATKPRKRRLQPELLQMGARMLAIITVMRPREIRGMNIRLPQSMLEDLRKSLGVGDPLETGKFFRRPIAWIRRTTSLSQLGKRGYSMIYNIRLDLLNSITCEKIGALDNKSRQAANKPINEFRDTFRGIKSLPMRSNETRNRCREAQTNLN